nr:hybrid signal transduction histidine kinase M [Tanacetum cinerariifolium]
AINLDNKLRSIKIGTMTVNEYCTKIRSMADRLKNLGCDVSDKNLVMYTVNGLDSRFATLVNIIPHRETLPSFETTRTMILLKESYFKDYTRTSSTFDGSSSSPTALVTSTASAPHVSSYMPSYNFTAGPTAFYTGLVHYSSQSHPIVHQSAQQAQFLQPQSAHQSGILGPPPLQATTLPSAFSTMTLQDPTWNMDTGSSSHLNANASNLRTVFNQRLFLSVHVGDGNSISVINTGPSPLLIPVTPPSTPAGPTSLVLAAAVCSSAGYSRTTSIT